MESDLRPRQGYRTSVGTAILFAIGKTLIGLYLRRSTVAAAYGTAGPPIVMLLCVYYSARVVFFGAEFTQVYASRFDRSSGGPASTGRPVGKRALTESKTHEAPAQPRELLLPGTAVGT